MAMLNLRGLDKNQTAERSFKDFYKVQGLFAGEDPRRNVSVYDRLRIAAAVASLLLIVNFVTAVQAQSHDTDFISSVTSSQMTTEAAVATPLNDPKKLLRFETTTENDKFPSVLIHAPKGSWDLSKHGEIKTDFKNTGEVELTVEFWAVGAPGWDAPVASVLLPRGAESECVIDLQQRWRGGIVNKVDSSHIEYLRVSLKKPMPGSRLEMGPISLGGSAASQQPADYQRLQLPVMVDAAPSAGVRVKHQLPQYEGTDVYHSLYLPSDWKPGKRFPIIVEYAGNRWLSAPCHSTGRPEGSRMGFGMSEGIGYIWVNAPFVNSKGKTQALNGWGDTDATVNYAVELVKHVCENFGGDPSAVILTGFSRGAVACGFIGRNNDRIADVWLAFHPCQHYDGDGVHGAKYEDAFAVRGPRITGRSTFHTDNDKHEKLRSMFDQLGFPVTYADSQLGAHTDTMFLENRPSTLALRKWLADVVANKPGTYTVAGRVMDESGKGLINVRIQSGETHFTFTDADGNYELPGLISGPRTFTASYAQLSQVRDVRLKQTDISGFDFVLQSD